MPRYCVSGTDLLLSADQVLSTVSHAPSLPPPSQPGLAVKGGRSTSRTFLGQPYSANLIGSVVLTSIFMLLMLRRFSSAATAAQSACADGRVSPIVQACLSEYHSTRLFRLDFLRRIDPRTGDAQLSRQWRHCYERLWRADADLQQNSRSIRIRESGEWSTAEWTAYNGPKHVLVVEFIEM